VGVTSGTPIEFEFQVASEVPWMDWNQTRGRWIFVVLNGMTKSHNMNAATEVLVHEYSLHYSNFGVMSKKNGKKLEVSLELR
jgi:hypothetical protein